MIDTQQLTVELQTFLAGFPLFRALDCALNNPSIHEVKWPRSVAMPCDKCTNERTTTWTFRAKNEALFVLSDGVSELKYRCVHCNDQETVFFVFVQRTKPPQRPLTQPGPVVDSITHVRALKIGQWPAWSVTPPKKLAKALGADVELYKKGAICLGQGYGVGAVAYFRRLVESQTGALLGLLEEGARAESDQAALDKIAAAKSSREASERLKLAAEAVPSNLRPGGTNPLATLYGLFSAGLHGDANEEECVEIAALLKDSIDHLFVNLRRSLDEAANYRASLTKAQELAQRLKKGPTS